MITHFQTAVFSCNTFVVDGAYDQLSIIIEANTKSQSTIPSFIKFNRLDLMGIFKNVRSAEVVKKNRKLSLPVLDVLLQHTPHLELKRCLSI